MQGRAQRLHIQKLIILIIYIIVYMLPGVFHVSHGAEPPRWDGHKDPRTPNGDPQHHTTTTTTTTTMSCDQRLMEHIFLCVSQHNVSVTDFLLAVGGINGRSKNYNAALNETKSKSTVDQTTATPSATTDAANDKKSNNKDNDNMSDNSNNNANAIQLEFSRKQNRNLQGDEVWMADENSRDSNSILNYSSTTLPDSVGHNSRGIFRHQESRKRRETTEDMFNSLPVKGDNTNNTTDSSGYIANIKEPVCRHQQEVMMCTFLAAKSLIENRECAPSATSESVSPDLLVNDPRYRVKSLLEAILGQYDNFCAHECRNNLIKDMRSCYEEFDLDPTLFMSRDSHDSVIGSTSYDVEVFCKNRDALVKCLRTKTDQCPESELVLSAIGLDLDLMENGFTVLCRNQYTYLRSLECFESHSPQVGICHSIKHRRIIHIASQATLHKWTRDKYLHEACRIRLEHIRCDLDAWANKDDKNCDEHVLNLKRQLHCSLIPPPCRLTHRASTDAICKANNSSSSTSGAASVSHSGIDVLVIVLVVLIQVVRCDSNLNPWTIHDFTSLGDLA